MGYVPMQRVGRTRRGGLEAHLLGHTGKVRLLVAVLLQQIVQILVLPHGGEHMRRILDNLDRKVLGVACDEHHALDAALAVAGLDEVVVALDALVDAGEHGGDRVLVQDTQAHRHWPLRVGQLVHQILHGVLSDELAILGVNGQIAQSDRCHAHNRLVLVLLGLEEMHKGGQTLELADLLAYDNRGAPVASGQILQTADGRLDRIAHRRLLYDDQVLVQSGQGPEELVRLTLARHGHIVRVD